MEWRNRIIGYDTKPASQFTPNPSNWRAHPSIQREALRGLLGDVGWVGAVLENQQTGNLIDGHARIEEALSQDGNTLIPYLLVDLSPDEEKLVLASFDPISALATSDRDKLESLLKEVSAYSEAVDSLLSEIAKKNGVLLDTEPKDAEPQIDKAAELQQKWGTETGQLWVIGNHRLLVGDATNKADVGRLCANDRVNMVFTDPPYGIDLDTDYSKLKGTAKSPRALGYSYSKVEGDETPFDFSPFADVKCAEQFWWGADYYAQQLPSGGSWNVWQKRNEADATMIGNDFEMCWSKSRHKKQIIRVRWVGWDATESNEKRTHPTQKPVELAEWYFKTYGREGDIIVDYFAGSGFAIVAAENLNRKCYAMEISPAYVAVCLERMTTAFPHLKIEKVDQARAA